MLIIFLGESFRLGGQNTRNRGSPESYKEQMNACYSHIRFIKNLKCDVDVFIGTYHTPYDEELLSVYEPYLIGSTFYPDVIGINNLFHKTIKEVDIEKYDSIFYIRIDLYLKDYFLEVFQPKQMILFPTICWKHDSKISGHPRVSDTMLFIPKKYYEFIKHIFVFHNVWRDLLEFLTYDDMDTIIQTYHDSDSEKDYNPLYYIVNRPQCEIFHSEGHIFDKYNF
jgi:hypothetical protein